MHRKRPPSHQAGIRARGRPRAGVLRAPIGAAVPRIAVGGNPRYTFGKCCGRDLEACQGAAVHRAQQADRGVAQAELGLPDRQSSPDEIRVGVVQRVRAAGHAERAAFTLPGGRLLGWVGGLECCTHCHSTPIFLFAFGACHHATLRV